MDEGQALELLDAAAQRREAAEVGHHVNGHGLVADRLEEPAQPPVLLVGERQDDVIHLVGVEHRAKVGEAAERLGACRRLLVAHQTENLDPGVRPGPHALDNAGRQLAPAHDEGVAQVVAPPAGDAEGLAEDVAREGHRRDRKDPEVDDDHARVVVLAEEKGHDADEDEGAHGRGLRDGGHLRQPRPDAPRAVQVEPSEGHAPDDEDGQEHEQIGLEGRDAVPGGRPHDVKTYDVREQPGGGDEQEVAHQHHLLEEPRARPQHRERSSRRDVR